MILNKTTNELINIKIINANSFFKRFKGLMLKKDIDFALLFYNLKDSSIHTHFMRFDIDVYFLDKNKIIFEKATLSPWKFYKPKKQAKYILETKKDCLNLKIGDKLDFI
ncbi:DUF192 domain-containing protein [Methanobrevibacter sp.]|uniref:DUF192 domain-containing protein n=1 Tax=Methanobrevibacter sp. TaxID=66852 RepID=UPI003870C873